MRLIIRIMHHMSLKNILLTAIFINPEIVWKGKEYRMAAYLGAGVVQIQNNMVRVIQGNLELEARLLEASDCLLKAPTKGDMVRTIHESASCRAFYRFCKKGCTSVEQGTAVVKIGKC